MSEVKAELSHIKNQLHTDLKSVLTDVELLLKVVADRTGEQVAAVRDRVDGNLKGALERLAQIDATLIGEVKQKVHDALHETSKAVTLVVSAAEISANASGNADAAHAETQRKAAHTAMDTSQEAITKAIHDIVSRL